MPKGVTKAPVIRLQAKAGLEKKTLEWCLFLLLRRYFSVRVHNVTAFVTYLSAVTKYLKEAA